MTTSELRHVRGLLNEIDIIQSDCCMYGTLDGNNANTKLDEFTSTKLNLNDILTILKRDIKTQKNIEKNSGITAESIKLKQEINRNILRANKLHKELKNIYNKQINNNHNDDNKEDIQNKEELIHLMKTDLDYVKYQFNPDIIEEEDGDNTSSGYHIAKDLRIKRQKRRKQKLLSSVPVPLTNKQQEFIQESIERERVLDTKLDDIKKGVQIINNINYDINNELDKQIIIINQVTKDTDKIIDKLQSRNEKMKEILNNKGGLTKLFCILILVIIFLACIGYIYGRYIA